MNNVFKQLAIQLDKIPNGYPETVSVGKMWRGRTSPSPFISVMIN